MIDEKESLAGRPTWGTSNAGKRAEEKTMIEGEQESPSGPLDGVGAVVEKGNANELQKKNKRAQVLQGGGTTVETKKPVAKKPVQRWPEISNLVPPSTTLGANRQGGVINTWVGLVRWGMPVWPWLGK